MTGIPLHLHAPVIQRRSLHDSVTQVASDAAEPFHILLAASLVNLLSRPRPKQRYTMEKSEPTFSWAPLLERMMRRKPMQVIQAEENSQDLPRSLSLFDLICIGIGGTVGSGIFSTAASIVSDTAGPSAVISWLIGGVVCCMNALAYMELTTRIPSSGSTYAYAYHAIGEMPAVVAGWLLTLEYAVSGAGVARSWAQKVEDWVILEHPDASVHWLNLEYSNILSAVIQGLCVVVLLAGLRFGKMFVNGFTILKLFVVIFIIIAGFCAIDADNLSPFIPARAENSSGDMAYGTQGIITGATQAFFGYIGFDEVCCLAAEAKNPKKVMPVAATSFPDGFSGVGWDWASQIVRAGETITMPVVVLIAFLAQPRLNYALACDGLMPEIFAKVDAKGNLFVNTLITGIFFTLVAFVVPFVTLWDIVNFGILISFVMSNSSLMMIRMSSSRQALRRTLALMTAFFYQQGYATHDSTVCLVIAIVCLVATVAMTIVLAIKCPQSGNDPLYFSAPLVPFIPMICILADFYLVAQIPNLGLILGVAWVLVGVLSYFVRNGWAELLQYHLPSINSAGDDSYVGLRPSLNEVRPSMNSMVKDN
ncbi:Cationic amino acid transporter, C-terminal [Phytophthora cactorum]|nr:Cationic amino acid transporter, C-terminal [Phytophthora cactorum]